jgi:2-polyprenyl-6-methoxyphenol hydroxylase-like FAD-dependent oxidoreductase
LRALFVEFAEPASGILRGLESFDSIHFSPIEEIVCETQVRGRVVLLGDAAHAMSPNMAEGASLALEDALVLARMLKTHGASAESLSVFSKRRRSRIRWVQRRTHRRDRVRSLPGLLRDLALRLGGTTLYRRDYQPLLEEP